MRQIKILAVMAGLLTCALFHAERAQAGDVYKYVDERGNTLYTDRPMPGAVRISAGVQRPQETQERAVAEQQTANTNQVNGVNQRFSENQSNQRAAEQVAKDLQATRLERCKKAREQYDASLNARKIYRKTDGGQREYLNDEEAAQARVDARKQVDAICGPQG